MDLKSLILYQYPEIGELQAAREIASMGKGEILWAINLAMAYGVILGKRRERARRKKG